MAMLLRDPLEAHIRLAARYGDAVRMPIGPGHSAFLFSRPEHAEHVFAVNQDNYVKATTYRPLRALIGNGLLTSEGEDWRRHRRLIQPVFSRRDVMRFGPAMCDATQRVLKGWDELPSGAVLNVRSVPRSPRSCWPATRPPLTRWPGRWRCFRPFPRPGRGWNRRSTRCSAAACPRPVTPASWPGPRRWSTRPCG